MKKYDLQAKIKEKFGNQKLAAIALSITEGTLSKNLRNPTDDFIARLKEIGVTVDSFSSNKSTGNNNIQALGGSSIVVDKTTSDLMQEVLELSRENREKEKRIRELEELLKQKGK